MPTQLRVLQKRQNHLFFLLQHNSLHRKIVVLQQSFGEKRFFLSPSRIAQISQTKETVGRLEAEFATFKLSIERRLLETVDSHLFQDKIYSLTQSNNLEKNH